MASRAPAFGAPPEMPARPLGPITLGLRITHRCSSKAALWALDGRSRSAPNFLAFKRRCPEQTMVACILIPPAQPEDHFMDILSPTGGMPGLTSTAQTRTK